MKMALFAAFFTHRHDLNDPAVLVDVAAELGLDRAAASEVLQDDRYGPAVREAEALWLGRGISGVPAMIFEERYLLSGAQGVENYAAALKELKDRRAA